MRGQHTHADIALVAGPGKLTGLAIQRAGEGKAGDSDWSLPSLWADMRVDWAVDPGAGEGKAGDSDWSLPSLWADMRVDWAVDPGAGEGKAGDSDWSLPSLWADT
ncbi:hypothetical protein ACOMHN_051572 [Nucella lapillus]